MRKALSLFVLALLSSSTFGQHLTVDITVRVEQQASLFAVQHRVIGDSVNDLQYFDDLNAWRDESSILRQELIHEQNVDLHFAKKDELGSFLFLSDSTLGSSRTLTYAFTPPKWELAEQGRSQTFFGMNRPFHRFYQNVNSDPAPANTYGYHSWNDNPTHLIIQNPEGLHFVVPGLPGVQRDSLIESKDARTFFIGLHLSEIEQDLGGRKAHWIFEDDFPILAQSDVLEKAENYLQKFYEYSLPEDLNILVLDEPGNLRSTGNIVILEWTLDPMEMELDLIQQLVELFYTNELNVNEYRDPWLSEGVAHYHRYDYQSIHYPNSKLFGAYASTYAARFLDVDELKPTYLHTWLYLYMARQGLDQAISDSALAFAPFNREAVVKGKTALIIGTLRGYVGERAFIRGLHRMTSPDQIPENGLTPEDFIAPIAYYSNRDTDWFLGDIYRTSKSVDYSLDDVDQCSYIATAEITNSGEVAIPYSTLGYDENGEPVIEEWHDGHLGTDTIQLHLEQYSVVTLDPNQTIPDLNNKNQWRKPTGLFQRIAPVRLQFYTGLDQANKIQIYWMPTVKFNAYDGVLAGITFYNKNIMPKRWEYKIGPEYSFRTGQLTGTASLRYYRPFSSGWLHALEAGVYGRYFHYDENLGYGRISPGVNFHLRKSHPRATVQQTIKLRGVGVDRELRPEDQELSKYITNARYWVTDLRYIREQQHILHPSLLEIELQVSDRFSRVGVSYRQRFMLPNRQWLGIRGFAGAFLHNNQPAGQPFFSFGLSGTQDYLFDYSFIGRSDSSGIWSQQFFVTDGGFKSATNVYSSTWMTSLSLNVPIWKGIGIFGDVGYSGYQNQVYWDYGIRLAIVPDFLEIYFPLQSSLTNHVESFNYPTQIRFILNVNQTDIIQRLRRGWY